MVKLKNIEWTQPAINDLKEVLEYYKKRSKSGYVLVKQVLLETIERISKDSTIFKIDDLKKPKDEKIRIFTIYPHQGFIPD